MDHLGKYSFQEPLTAAVPSLMSPSSSLSTGGPGFGVGDSLVVVGGWEDVGVCCGDSDDGAGMDDGDVPADDEIVIGEFGRPPVVEMHALSVTTERAINPIATTVQPGRAMPIRPVPARGRTVH